MEEKYPPAAVAWVAVGVFFLATVIAIMDRGMLALVIDPIRHDLGISEVQIALLQGLAFAVFYVSVGLPLGLIADLVSRRRLLMTGIVVWSAATVGCGLARDFGQMFAARLFVGFGEAALAPCVVTLLGDLFPPQRRGRPMAVYVLGSIVAQGLGSVVSGNILAAAPRGVFAGIPLLADLAPWRIAFVLVGASGLLVAAGVGLLREPRRRGVALEQRRGLGIGQARAWLGDHRRLFLPFYAVLMTYALGVSVAAAWGAVLLTRNYGFDPASAGKALGAAQIAASLLGAGVAGVVVDPIARVGRTRGKILFAGLLALLALPSALAGLAESSGATVALLTEVMFVNSIFGTTMLSTTTEMVPVGMKGLSIALYAFVMSMIGSSLGPLLVATLTQKVFADPHRVGTSMAIVGSAALFSSAMLAFWSARRFERERRHSAAFAEVVRSNLV